MSKVKGVGFGVRFYRKAVPGKQMAKPTKGKDTPPQEISEPFPMRERQPVIDVPDQTGNLSLFETWPPTNAATTLAQEIQKAKQVLQKPEAPQALELMPQESVMQKSAFQKPPALQAALKKAEEKKQAKAIAKATDITKEVHLWTAAQSGDCGKIRKLVMEGVDLEMRDSYGRTALNIAMQYNQKDAMKTIMAAKEMRKMAVDGSLPNMNFFRQHAHKKTGTE